MTKYLMPNQHDLLHPFYGKNDCCLCKAESRILELEKQTLTMDKQPCHCNYDKDGCCGVFDEIDNGEITCNECGMTLIELLETLVGR